MKARQMFVEVLAGVVLLSSTFAAEALGRGEKKTVAEKRQGKVAGVFLERNRKASIIWVKVERVLAGDRYLQGETVRFFAQWVKKEGKWVPKPEEVALFRSVRRGDKLVIEYYTDEHYRVRKLSVLERRSEAEGTIEAGEPTYRHKDGERWRERGRIVGRLRSAPAAEMDLLNAQGEVLKEIRVTRGTRSYEIEWLTPGIYTLRVAARGYETLTVPNLEVRAKHDLVLPIEFSRPGGRTIEHSTPVHKRRTGGEWENAGRIVGRLLGCPGAEMDILGPGGEEVTSLRLKEGPAVYETEWLRPGEYTMRVAAKGYRTLELRVEVRARADLWITLEF